MSAAYYSTYFVFTVGVLFSFALPVFGKDPDAIEQLGVESVAVGIPSYGGEIHRSGDGYELVVPMEPELRSPLPELAVELLRSLASSTTDWGYPVVGGGQMPTEGRVPMGIGDFTGEISFRYTATRRTAPRLRVITGKFAQRRQTNGELGDGSVIEVDIFRMDRVGDVEIFVKQVIVEGDQPLWMEISAGAATHIAIRDACVGELIKKKDSPLPGDRTPPTLE